jgi:4,5-dihydroxyphthalate decarboxylase
VLKARPEIAGELIHAFERSKAEYLKDLKGNETTSWDKAATVNAKVVGDPFPFGIEPNRKALEAITQFAFDQKMVPRKTTVEDLFAVPG